MFKLFRFGIIALFVLLYSAAFAKEPIRTVTGTVTKVSDGDTIHVADSVTTKFVVRLYGIDAPETEKSNKKTGKISKPGQPFGKDAHDALQNKIMNKTVSIDIMDIDHYQRNVSIVWIADRNINLEMVKEGKAWAYKQYLDRPYASEYIQAETDARLAGIGLWQQPNPQPPWEFRKYLKIR